MEAVKCKSSEVRWAAPKKMTTVEAARSLTEGQSEAPKKSLLKVADSPGG